LLPIEYTNSAPAKSTNSVTNRTVVSLLPEKFLDQDRHAFGSITPDGSNVVVRLHISPAETLRKVTNEFYSPDGKRLGGIHFVHTIETVSDTNRSSTVGSATEPKTNRPIEVDSDGHIIAGASPTNHLKGVVELDRKDATEIVRTLEKRYTGLLKNYNDLTNDDYVLEEYLTALAHTYDPHSDYMGHASTENFNISMRLSLSGIGAVLKQEDGDCKVGDLVAEGPAAKSGRITNDDIITAVAQKDQEPVTVTGMPLLKVVGMIRGPKGTPVTLTVLKAHPTDPSSRQITVTLVRDVIKLEDQTAKAKLYENTNSTTPRIAVIDLSSFYANNDPDPPGEPPQEHVSTSKDVARLITRLKKENVDGIILDLRRNGGGFLEEAIRLTGLFVNGRVPVVQTKEPDEAPGQPGRIDVDSTPKAPVLYDGPLMLLTSRLSASASEIVAGALQDYGRALIVGDKSTFGKGTVQSVFAMSNLMVYQHLPYSYDPGSLKVTIKKFYRAGGSSTQSNGVASDIVLPSILNWADVGESSLSNPMPWDEVTSAELPDLNLVKPYLPELQKRSLGRRATNLDFAYLQEDIAEYRKSLADKSLSINEAVRLGEQSVNEARLEARKLERSTRPKSTEKVYEITLKNVDLPDLHPPEVKPKIVVNSTDDDTEPSAAAPTASEDSAATEAAVTQEARQIMADYITLLKKAPSTAKVP
jgi:carboxyl-terminal processing protease